MMYRMSTITGMNRMADFAFIGMGNMGQAMLKGCLSCFPADDFVFSRKDPVRGRRFAEETGAAFLPDNAACAAAAKYIILAVKPQFYEEVISQISPRTSRENIIISLAPSYRIDALRLLFANGVRIVRAMPNTPAAVGEGMTGISFSDDEYTDEERQTLDRFFRSFGRVEVVPERLMGAVTAASGSSPAFVYMMIEALADGVVRGGMPRSQAYIFAAQAVLGSAKMVLETGRHPGELKDAVCSPGGTTIEGVAVLEGKGFRSSLIEAADAVLQRCADK